LVWWFDFRLEPTFLIVLAVEKNVACFIRGQMWPKIITFGKAAESNYFPIQCVDYTFLAHLSIKNLFLCELSECKINCRVCLVVANLSTFNNDSEFSSEFCQLFDCSEF